MYRIARTLLCYWTCMLDTITVMHRRWYYTRHGLLLLYVLVLRIYVTRLRAIQLCSTSTRISTACHIYRYHHYTVLWFTIHDIRHWPLLWYVHVAPLLWPVTLLCCSHVPQTYIHSPLHGYSLHRQYCYTCFPHECPCLYCFYLLVIWLTVHIIPIIVPCYHIHVIRLFPVTDMDFPLLDLRAVDMRYVKFHIYCSHYIVPVILFPLYWSCFPLYCSMLSIELWSSYHVTRIMYSSYSCHIVYLTYQIIKLTWV